MQNICKTPTLKGKINQKISVNFFSGITLPVVQSVKNSNFFDILQIPDLAVTEDNFKTVWDMNKDGELDLAELITNVYTFALVQ